MRLVQRHFADVHQAFDALFELDEGAVAHHVDDRALDDRADRVLAPARVPTGWRSSASGPGRSFPFRGRCAGSCTSISWSMATISDGWPMRPQLMSVMCSRPSMPPRSTNAPNSAMFLTTPLRSWPTSSCLSSCALLFGPLGFDRGAAADDDIAARFVDLEHDALDGAADVVADVGRPADIDLAGGQEHVDADVDQQAALDLAGDHAGDDVVFVDGLHDLQPGFDLLGLALAEGDHAAIVLRPAGRRLRRLRRAP